MSGANWRMPTATLYDDRHEPPANRQSAQIHRLAAAARRRQDGLRHARRLAQARARRRSKITVLEPQPGKAVKALARRGLKLNPKGKAPKAAAIVIAVKPQIAPEAVPPLAPHVGKGTLVLSIMAGRTIGFCKAPCPPARPSCAPCRTRRRRSAAASRSRSPMAKSRARQRKQASDLLAAIGAVEWVSDEGADGRGHRACRAPARLMSSCWRRR